MESVAQKVENLEKNIQPALDKDPDFIALDLDSFTILKEEVGVDPLDEALTTFKGYDILIKTDENEGELIRFGNYI